VLALSGQASANDSGSELATGWEWPTGDGGRHALTGPRRPLSGADPTV